METFFVKLVVVFGWVLFIMTKESLPKSKGNTASNHAALPFRYPYLNDSSD